MLTSPTYPHIHVTSVVHITNLYHLLMHGYHITKLLITDNTKLVFGSEASGHLTKVNINATQFLMMRKKMLPLQKGTFEINCKVVILCSN